MTNCWGNDITKMHSRYGVHDWVYKNRNDHEKMKAFLQFRMNFLTEEYNETMAAYENNDVEEMIDGLIDLCVIAIGTLDAFNVDPSAAWKQVLKANMSKEVGVKSTRPNKLGLPDLIKPYGWVCPDHSDNHGNILPNIMIRSEYNDEY